jgi:two-component system response regulator YesN
MKVLIVDDDIPTTQAIKKAIDWNVLSIKEVYTANSFARAKKLITEISPQIIICDIEMPKGSGIDLIRWVREQGSDSRFLFLTCHADFIYASEAIKYEADAYITKPFDVEKMQAAIAKVAQKVARHQELRQYGERWVNNAHQRENSFWRDLLFDAFRPDQHIVKGEIESRGIGVDYSAEYRLVLGSVRESQPEENGWDSDTFRYALRNLTSEILTGSVDAVRTLDYQSRERYRVVSILPGDDNVSGIQDQCEKMIEMSRDCLQCSITCYIGDKTALWELPEARKELEEADAYNIIKRGTVIDVTALDKSSHTLYSFNSAPIERLLREERGVEAVNRLRHVLEELSAQDKLNRETMQSIQHDYMQIIYAILYDHDIQAHELFSDAPSQKLYQASSSSVFDMMKWASYITSKTFQYIKESREADTIVDRLKRFIGENYMRRLSRDDIASSVFLSPDYVSKIFKNETGQYIKDYVTEIRIEKAKQLLREGKMNISEVATSVGFDNFSYFSTIFKKVTGVSPSEYKR